MASVAYSDGAPRWVVTALTVAAAGSGVALKRVKGIGAASSTVGHHGGAISLTDGALVLWRLEAIVGGFSGVSATVALEFALISTVSADGAQEVAPH